MRRGIERFSDARRIFLLFRKRAVGSEPFPSIIGKVYNLKGYKPLTAMYGSKSEQSRKKSQNNSVSNCIKEHYFVRLDGVAFPTV